MIELELYENFFEHPKNLEKECCFAVALINYFRLNNIEIDESQLFEKHLTSPYTTQNGGVDILLQPKQVEYLTDEQYTATLYHVIHPWKENPIENIKWKPPEKQEDKIRGILEEMIKNGNIQYSKENIKRLIQPSDKLGVITNIYSLDTSGKPCNGHAIVKLNPSLYGARTHIEVDGNVYQMEGTMYYAGCLNITKS